MQHRQHHSPLMQHTQALRRLRRRTAKIGRLRGLGVDGWFRTHSRLDAKFRALKSTPEVA